MHCSSEPIGVGPSACNSIFPAGLKPSRGEEAADYCLIVKLAAEVADLSDAMRAIMLAGTEQIPGRLADVLARGQQDGSIGNQEPPHELAQWLYEAWLGASLLATKARWLGLRDRDATHPASTDTELDDQAPPGVLAAFFNQQLDDRSNTSVHWRIAMTQSVNRRIVLASRSGRGAGRRQLPLGNRAAADPSRWPTAAAGALSCRSIPTCAAA